MSTFLLVKTCLVLLGLSVSHHQQKRFWMKVEVVMMIQNFRMTMMPNICHFRQKEIQQNLSDDEELPPQVAASVRLMEAEMDVDHEKLLSDNDKQPLPNAKSKQPLAASNNQLLTHLPTTTPQGTRAGEECEAHMCEDYKYDYGGIDLKIKRSPCTNGKKEGLKWCHQPQLALSNDLHPLGEIPPATKSALEMTFASTVFSFHFLPALYSDLVADGLP
ncbi:hypothetical protein EVAR_80463_1 [Eumeta japonica]|uniref:Uncharacterized protein n=1 Tax=Eumeta variegata TaxID=151549 RepID=A0A4C1VIR0_EUMVA|nr:hypothetical protein EVAR_80463_1 [Eumeta japonica]